MPALAEVLANHVSQRVARRPVLVWYDPSRSLEALVEAAVPEGVGFLRYEGSFLALRAQFERADPKLELRSVLYVGAQRPAISWLRDLELTGTHELLTLRQLVSRAFGLSLAAPIRHALEGPVGPILAARWNELVGQPPDSAGLQRALLAASLRLPTSDPRDIVLALVRDDQTITRVAELGLEPVLRSFLAAQGLNVDRRQLGAERVAAALLLSEAVAVGGLEEEPLRAALPETRHRRRWVAWARDWIHGRDAGAFRRWSREIEHTFRIGERLYGVDAQAVESFACVDEVLLPTVEDLLQEGKRTEARALAERRTSVHWARRAEQAGDPLFWSPLLAALELLEQAEQVVAELSAAGEWALATLLDRYADGWWQLDDAYRRLEAAWSRLPDRLRTLSALPACRAYAAFLEAIGQAAAQAATEAWEAVGWSSQSSISRQLGSGARTALILADALRFDLGQLLAQHLRARGISVEATRTLVAVPSVTEIGMASILAGGEARELVADGGRAVPRADGSLLRGRSERLEMLRRRLGRVEDVELDEVNAGRVTRTNRPLLVYARAIDEQGDALPQVGLDLFERLVGEIARAVETLLGLGYERVVVAPDHGFVLVPRDVEARRVPLRGGDPSLVRKPRYAIGRPPEVEGTVRAPLDRLGWSGNEIAVFPRGLAVFALPGETPRFFHGGPMPQEVAVLTLDCRRPAPTGVPVRVRLSEPGPIDTMLPRFALVGEPAEDLLTMPRTVRVVVKLGGAVIGVSEPVNVAPGGTAEPTVRLERYGERVQLLVEDIDTREVLEDVNVPVTLPAGYEDLGI